MSIKGQEISHLLNSYPIEKIKTYSRHSSCVPKSEIFKATESLRPLHCHHIK